MQAYGPQFTEKYLTNMLPAVLLKTQTKDRAAKAAVNNVLLRGYIYATQSVQFAPSFCVTEFVTYAFPGVGTSRDARAVCPGGNAEFHPQDVRTQKLKHSVRKSTGNLSLLLLYGPILTACFALTGLPGRYDWPVSTNLRLHYRYLNVRLIVL